MRYNERLIDIYEEKKLIELLKDVSHCDQLLTAKLNRLNYDFDCVDFVLLDVLDNFLVKTILNDPYKLDANSVISYRNLLFNKFKENPNIVLESILFRNEILIKLFTDEQIKEIKKYKYEISKRVADKMLKNQEDENYSIDEETIKYAIAVIGTENSSIINFLDNVYKQLLKDPFANKSLLESEFILKYTAYLATKDLNIPEVSIYISNTDLFGKHLSSGNLGNNYGNTSIIIINRQSLINEYLIDKNVPPIIQFMQTISHETKHSSQAYECSTGAITKSSFEYIKSNLFRNYLTTDSFNEYKKNYMHYEIESDANIYGWKHSIKCLEKYCPSAEQLIKHLASNNIKTSWLETTATKIDGINKKRKSRESYNVESMNSIIQMHLEELDRYPILKKIYHDNGKRKTFMELIDTEQNILDEKEKNEIKKITMDYFIYDLDQGYLNDKNPETLSIEQQIKIFMKIFEILQHQLIELKHSMKMYAFYNKNDNMSLIRKKEFDFINDMRVKRIKQLVNFLNQYQNLILNLKDYDLMHSNKIGFGREMYFTQTRLIEVQNALKNSTYLKESETYEEILSLGEVEYNGFKRN